MTIRKKRGANRRAYEILNEETHDRNVACYQETRYHNHFMDQHPDRACDDFSAPSCYRPLNFKGDV